MRVGFTGTREKLTDAQLGWLYQLLEEPRNDVGPISEIHHGACVGADSAVHHAALDNEYNPIVVHPPTDLKLVDPQCLRANERVIILPREPYLHRDRAIVAATDTLIALPRHEEQPPPNMWGGTWYTVNFAQRMGRPIIICYPSGRVAQPAYDRIQFD